MISVVPSVDTPVYDQQTRRFNESKLLEVKIGDLMNPTYLLLLQHFIETKKHAGGSDERGLDDGSKSVLILICVQNLPR